MDRRHATVPSALLPRFDPVRRALRLAFPPTRRCAALLCTTFVAACMQAELVFSTAKAWKKRHTCELSAVHPCQAINGATEHISPQGCLGFVRNRGAQYMQS